MHAMSIATKRTLAASIALSLGLALGGCGAYATNQSLNSTHQAVVERTNFTLDVATNGDGLPVSELNRIDNWFEVMDLRYGDRVSIEDPMASPETRRQIADLAARHGILVSDGTPVTAGFVQPGQARVVITRSVAAVPGCPDWSVTMEANQNNATHSNFGCSTNSNIAAMVAHPEDLLTGQVGTGETVVTTSTKAIQAYREAEPTGSGGLTEADTSGGN